MKPERNPIVRSCETCDFAGSHADSDRLRICRKRCAQMMDGVGNGKWPVVKITEWCGEYKERLGE